MHLTRYSDYSLRVLIFLALQPGEISRVAEIAEAFNVSRNHLVKVVNNLSRLGYIRSSRGHGGGIKLDCNPDSVTVGSIVRQTEKCLDAINCGEPYCPILPACRLKDALNEATEVFLNVLDQYTLTDLVQQKKNSGNYSADSCGSGLSRL